MPTCPLSERIQSMNYRPVVFTLALGIAALRWRATVLARQAEADYPPTGAFLTVMGYRLHYRRSGSGAPIVLLYGSDGFLEDFDPLFEATAGGPGDFIAFDRPWHGHSEGPRRNAGTLATQVRVLHAALNSLRLSQPPILVGHSWGGALALAYALEYPEEVVGLTLVNPWIYPTADRPANLIYAGRLAGGVITNTTLAITPIKRFFLRRSLERAYAPDPVPRDYERAAMALWQRGPRQTAVFLQELTDAWTQFRTLAPRYPTITAPVVIVTGECDAVVHPQFHGGRLHSELPTSTLIMVPNAGHELPQTRPNVVLDAIRACETQAAAQVAVAASSPYRKRIAPLGDPQERARELVFRFGWNPTAYQILNPDIDLWFAPDGEAVVGYLRRFHTRVAAGAPICEEHRLTEVASLFEQDAAANGESVCWFAATPRLLEAIAKAPPRAVLAIGAEPVWNPVGWTDILAKNSSLRAQLNRARNKKAAVSEWPTERAANDPNLQRCMDEWLSHHALPTLHFLTEPVTLDRLADRRVFVAESKEKVVGFLVLTPIPSRNGWLVEQIVRGKDAPNGAAELMVDAAMRALAADGYTYITLGLAPLTGRGNIPLPPPPLWLQLGLKWARLHGSRFYNFEGLDAFKAKFKPDSWEPLFAISNERRPSVRTSLAIAAAFSDGSLSLTALRTLSAAARQEFVWLGNRLAKKRPEAQQSQFTKT